MQGSSTRCDRRLSPAAAPNLSSNLYSGYRQPHKAALESGLFWTFGPARGLKDTVGKCAVKRPAAGSAGSIYPGQ